MKFASTYSIRVGVIVAGNCMQGAMMARFLIPKTVIIVSHDLNQIGRFSQSCQIETFFYHCLELRQSTFAGIERSLREA